MAVNLNPGADQTLVAAAYRASMANVPKDLSGTFEALATNYANTMKIVGDTWKGVAEDVGALAGKAISKAVQNVKMGDKAFAFSNKTGTTFLIDRLNKIKKGEWDSWKTKKDVDVEMESEEDYEAAMNELSGEGVSDVNLPSYEDWKEETQKTEKGKVSNNPFSRENRAKRIELRQRRDKLYADIDALMGGSINLNKQLASGNVSELGTGKINMMIANGLQSMNTLTGKSEDGTYLKPGEDENENLTFTLYGPKGMITGTDAEGNITYAKEGDKDAVGVMVDASNIDKVVTNKNQTSLTNANTLLANMAVNAKNSNSKAGIDNYLPKFRNDMASTVSNQNDLHFMMNERLYDMPETFMQDLTNEGGSVTSAGIFGMLKNTIPTDSQGNELPLEDVPGTSKGITEADFTTGATGVKNYQLIVDALTNKRSDYYDENVTREVYLDWTENSARKSWTLGESQRSTDTNNKNGITMNAGTYYRTGQGDQKEIGSDILKRYNLFNNNKNFKTYNGIFEFGLKDGQWQVTGPSDPKKDQSFDGPTTTRPISQYDISEIMGFNNQSHMLNFDPEKLSKVGADDEADVADTTADVADTDSGIDIPIANVDAFRVRANADNVLNNWKVDYPDFEFVKEGSGNSTNIIITAPNGKKLTAKMNRPFGPSRKEQAKEFNKFIKENKQ